MIFSTLQINHPPLGLGRVVKAVPHVAAGLMKGSQLSDNLFSAGLSVNHVDSISWDGEGLRFEPLSVSHQRLPGKRDGGKKNCRGK